MYILKGKNKKGGQIHAIKDIKTLYKSREKVIKLLVNYSRIVSEAKYKTKYGEALKMLTPKLMLQRLLIALKQLKADNISEKLLNEVGQIIYSLHRTKEITKKVYNNILNSKMVQYKNEYYIYKFQK